ncbi:MAG: glycosyltransferase involved in cell wall biosynthesis [Flavobacteriaceae bacterium]|jgi:glycosyltransferase involved in cell wall biosynthesis
MAKKLFILAPYPLGKAPSQRFRFEQYMNYFSELGFDVEFHPFLNDKTWSTLYVQGSFFKKSFGMIGSFWRRFLLLFRLRKATKIIIHREASMIGPALFEWTIAKILRKKYIYDFDDAIWLPNFSESNAKFHRLKAYAKVKRIIKWAETVNAGNEYLKNYALRFNSNVAVFPTTIDLKNVHNKTTNHSAEPVIIGWTGTHTTMHYLDFLIPILKELETEYNFIFRVISNEEPKYDLKSLEFLKWNKSSEIEDLAKFSMGVMPLTDTIWAKGKCGFKGLQYMALEIPSIMSPIGVNKSIIDHGVNGFLCADSTEWKATIKQLLHDAELRKIIGKAGKKTIKERYSVEANESIYAKILTH